jgi:hypothetical protein
MGFDTSRRREQPSVVRLSVPEPPSPNALPTNRWARADAIRRVKEKTWIAALSQETPFARPHRLVSAHIHFRLHQLRDEDNLKASAKHVLDALKQRPSGGDKLKWRHGLYLDRGYLFDDGPTHCAITVSQEVDRGNRGATVTIREETDLKKLREG